MKRSFLYYRKSLKMLHSTFKFYYIVTGLYTFVLEKCDTDVVMKSRRKIYSVLYMTVVSLIMTASLIQRYALVEEKDNFYNFLFLCIYGCTNLLGQVTMISFAYKIDTYVVLMNRLDEFDKKLKKLHVVVWNTAPFWMIIYHTIILLFCLNAIYLADKSLQKKLLDVLCVYLPAITKCVMICAIILMLLFLWQRCHGINLLLDELDDAVIDDNIGDRIMNTSSNSKIISEQEATDILMNVAVLLEQLVEITELIKDMFSVMIFINCAVFIFLTSIIVPSYMFYATMTEISGFEYCLLLLIYTAQPLLVYIFCHLLETETKNIYISLGLLNIYYLTPKLALMKNTLLLQGLHNKVDMNLFGVIPLKPSFFLKQLDVCKTIILLLTQYYYKSKRA